MAARDSKSKKRSAAKSTPKRQPEQPSFFIDICLGGKDVPDALQSAGLRIERHRDHFSPDCEDSEWLTEVGRRGWVVLRKDAKFRYRQVEIQAQMKAAVRCFALTSGDATGAQNAQAIMIAIPQMIRMIAKYPAPFIATITAAGRVKLLLTKSDLLRKM